MPDTAPLPRDAATGVALPARAAPRIPVKALGFSLSSFLAISYVLCVLFDLWFPDLAMRGAWLPLLPGVVWLSWQGFLLGLAESFVYGWYVALVFAPLFNICAARFR
jgi:uncharacterized membrane protein